VSKHGPAPGGAEVRYKFRLAAEVRFSRSAYAERDFSGHGDYPLAGCDEASVRRARKANTACAELDDEQRINKYGKVFKIGGQRRRKPAVKLFAARRLKGYKPPTKETC
jgi:hypothetical protein